MNTTNTARAGYDDAASAIKAGEAEAHALWVLLSDEHERDAYALKPAPWEGPGEYQRVTYADGRDVFVRVPGWRSLPVKPTSPRAPAQEQPAAALQRAARAVLFCLDSPLTGDVRPLMQGEIRALRDALAILEA